MSLVFKSARNQTYPVKHSKGVLQSKKEMHVKTLARNKMGPVKNLPSAFKTCAYLRNTSKIASDILQYMN